MSAIPPLFAEFTANPLIGPRPLPDGETLNDFELAVQDKGSRAYEFSDKPARTVRDLVEYALHLEQWITTLRNGQQYLYIGRYCKPILARELEDMLILSEKKNAKLQKLLDGRDKFLVEQGMWDKFVKSLV